MSPEMVRSTNENLKRDMKAAVNAIHGTFKTKIEGEQPVKKLGYVKARIGRSERKTDFMLVPASCKQVSMAQLMDTIRQKWNLTKPSMFISLRGETKGSKLRAKWGSNGIAVTG